MSPNLSPDVAAVLAQLNARTSAAAPDWLAHEHATHELRRLLLAGDESAEPVFLDIFTRLADHLLVDNPADFHQQVASARDLPLRTPGGRQLLLFYQGLSLGLADRYAEALQVFDDLLAAPDLSDLVRGRCLNSRANYLRYSGRLQEALEGYRASLDLWRRLGNRLREGLAQLNLGITAYDLFDYDEAERQLLAAARCFEEVAAPSWLAAAQNELGLVCRDRGRLDDALQHLHRAEAYYIAQKASDPLSRVRNNIGEVLLFREQVNDAANAFRQALADMGTRTYAVDAHLNLGLALQVAGDLAGALASYQEALDLAQAIGRRDILAHAHYRLGDALRLSGRADAALAQFVAAAQVVETTRQPLRDEGLKISLMGRWQQVYEALVLHCVALGRLADAFAWAEQARARAFSDATASGVEDTGGELARLTLTRGSGTITCAELQAALPQGAALFAYFTTGVLADDQPALRALAVGSAVREHLITPARTLLFVLTRDHLTAQRCPLDPNALASISPRTHEPMRYLAPPVRRRLYDLLVAPAGAPSSDGSTTRRLYIAPHGPLHRVPFGATVNPAGETLLHDGGPALLHVPSATILLHLLRRQRTSLNVEMPGNMLAIGFDAPAGADAGTLRHTEAEATYIASVTGGQAWVGPQPKLGELQQAARHCGGLHFACHGHFDDEHPLASYLETGSGERLTADQVMNHWELPHTLVVLSACQSGVSRMLRGDEPMGLVRAFLYAGARAVVVSQWAVDDLSTFLLMRRFYDVLTGQGSKTDPAAALQAAQLWLRDLSGAETFALLSDLMVGRTMPGLSATDADYTTARPFGDPRHWCAFVLVGAG